MVQKGAKKHQLKATPAKDIEELNYTESLKNKIKARPLLE